MSTSFWTPGSIRAHASTRPFRVLRRTAITLVVALAGPPAVAGSAIASGSERARCAASNITVTDDASRKRAIRAVRCLINRERTMRGRPALRGSKHLRRAAVGHTADMVSRRRLSHVGSTGQTLRTRASRAGYVRAHDRRWKVGEAIAWASGRSATPARLVASMMASPSHRQVILDRRYRELGIAMRFGSPRAGVKNRAVTMTVDFGCRTSSAV